MKNQSSPIICIDSDDDDEPTIKDILLMKQPAMNKETGKLPQSFPLIYIDDDDDEPIIKDSLTNRPKEKKKQTGESSQGLPIIYIAEDYPNKKQNPKRKETGESSHGFPFIDLNYGPSDQDHSIKKQKVEKKESTKLAVCVCVICMEEKHPRVMFNSNKCTHYLFCNDCICQHVTAKTQENILNVKCPDLRCSAILDPEDCRSIVPQEVLNRWEIAVCESLIPESQKFYCPYHDCSAMLIRDGCKSLIKTECPNCRRQICVQCKVPWHEGMRCKSYQQTTKRMKERQDDEYIVKLAQRRRWKRCPNCNFYVQKEEGCRHISCRCGGQFCYTCGEKWAGAHQCPPRQKKIQSVTASGVKS